MATAPLTPPVHWRRNVDCQVSDRFRHALKSGSPVDAIVRPRRRAETDRVGRGEREKRRSFFPHPNRPGLALAGNVFALLRNMRSFVTERYLEFGPVYRIRVMNRRFTVLAGPDANRFAHRDDPKHLRSFEYWGRSNARFGAARYLLTTTAAGFFELLGYRVRDRRAVRELAGKVAPPRATMR